MLIAIDHGNYAIKTPRFTFVSSPAVMKAGRSYSHDGIAWCMILRRTMLCCSHNGCGKEFTMAAEKFQNTNLRQAQPEKRTYSVPEIAEILQIRKSRAHALCEQSQFKPVQIGKYVRISKTSFDSWLDSTE